MAENLGTVHVVVTSAVLYYQNVHRYGNKNSKLEKMAIIAMYAT